MGQILDRKVCEGRFADKIKGIEYSSNSFYGKTDEKGSFIYAQDETITFSIQGLVLGSCVGKELLTEADLVYSVGGDIKKLKYRNVTNLARFMQSLSGRKHLENGYEITEDMGKIIRQYADKISFDQSEKRFSKDKQVAGLMEKLGVKLRSAEQARNHLRRSLHGIRKYTDVKVPVRDGSYVLADVFTPIKEGKYPVIMSYGGYGKAFWRGCIRNEDDFQKAEVREDNYFEGIVDSTPFIQFHKRDLAGEKVSSLFPPGGNAMNPMLDHISEGFEIANTLDWVPYGYVVIRVDGKGTGDVPGMHEQFSRHEAEFYHDTIEWAGQQEWSNGNVGTYGASYYAMNAFNMSTLQPSHLKAMIAIAGDLDYYRDCTSPGGLCNTFSFTAKCSCGEWKGLDVVEATKKSVFDDPANSPFFNADPDKIKVPFWTAIPLENMGIHTRGSSEAFIHAASEHKKLTLVSEVGVHYWMYVPKIVKQHRRFMDYWLKGEENGIMDEPRVDMLVRTGHHAYYWRKEENWPVKETEYKKLYLSCDENKLQKALPKKEGCLSYKTNDKNGQTFLSEPMEKDTLFAGYFKLKVWCSSTSNDMALRVNVRGVDEKGVEVPFDVQFTYPKMPWEKNHFPAATGALKVSHRKQDMEKATEYRPYHTHKREDCQLLKSNEVVECEVEIAPTTMQLKKGWRLRIDLLSEKDIVDSSYQKGAVNKIYSGDKYESYLQMPVIK